MSQPRLRAPRGRAGFTIVEMLVSTTVLVGLISITLSLLRTSTDEFQVEVTVATLEGEALRAMEILSSEMRNSPLSQVHTQIPVSPGSGQTLVFQEVTGFSGMAPIYGPSVTYAYRWNATANWGEVTRTQNGRTEVLVSRLQANGFRLERDPVLTNKLTIRLSLELPGPYGSMIVRSLETSVFPRN